LRFRTLGALSALAVIVAVVAAVPAATGSSAAATATYIVQLVQAPVAGYEGGIAGYPATKPGKGKKLDATSADAQKYAALLTDKHNKALDKVGAGNKIYDYTAAFNGFAANITEEQAAKLDTVKEVLSVEKAETVRVDTSSTPAFLGLDKPGGLWAQLGGVNKGGVGSGAGEDVVIGDVDGGYWPENPSFSDRKVDGSNGNLYPHKVTGFHGACQAGEAFAANTCNNKVISARYYNAGIGPLPDWEFVSPRDYGGHGTHTASTMAGNNGVQATGDAAGFGKTSGMAPRARLAVYKACWVIDKATAGSCNSADTTAAIDQAVEDGVDAINYSISGTTTAFTNSVEVSFLFAAAAGVYVSASAGNSGPTASTVAHPSPWITTTAAGTHNRDGLGTATINGIVYNGHSSSATAVSGTLINAVAAKRPTAADADAALCFIGSLDPAKVAGKIVVCDRGVNARIDKSLEVKNAGGIGMIMVNTSPNSVNADLHFVPTIHLGDGDAAAIHAAATAGRTAALSKGTLVYNADAPFTAAFSSRGPILAGGGDILKPDIMAPGQDILASVAPPGNHGRDFDLYSGTSMSSPHMTALGALLHQAHTDWSPMMIKSAFMTTAYQGHDYDAFNWGAGHVDPNKAVNPGLVFDSNLTDWLAFLKGQGLYTGSGATMDASDLNSASIAIGDLAGSQTVSRKAMSVGSKSETYQFSYSGLAGITVAPSASSFTAAPGSVTPWSVTFTRTAAAPLDAYAKGFIIWTGNQGHVVKMPTVIKPVRFSAPLEVSGFGANSNLTYNTKAGYPGTLSYSIRGLQEARKFNNSVNGDPACNFNTANPDSMVSAGFASVNSFTTPAGASYIRFQTFQSDSNTNAASQDLDMFVYRAPAAPAPEVYTLVLTSGGPDASEVTSSTSSGSLQTGARFKVYVHGCSVGPGPGTFTLFAWGLTGTPSNPFAPPTPSTHAVTIGQVDATTFNWSGLPASNRYLGRVIYSDGAVNMAATQIEVSTR
jgi:subtilase family protein/fibronectin type III domain protein/PA domain-containing protein/peptidase inhibitor I9